MAVSAITALQLGNVLQIAYNKGLVKQLSENWADWQNIKSYSTGKFDGKQYQFMVQTSYGPASVQYRNATTRAYPAAQSMTTEEATVVAKEVNQTLSIQANLWERALASPSKYFEPLAMEIESKHMALQRRFSIDLYGDGTGVLGTVASGGLVESDIANGNIVITLSAADAARGFCGWFETGDLVLFKTPAGAAHTLSGGSPTGTFYAWQVVGLPDRVNKAVSFRAVTSTGAVITGAAASNIVATDVAYRVGQPTFPDLTSLSSIGDFGTCSDVFTGLESLSANDGRTLHGLVMSGLLAGTRKDCSAAALDVDHLNTILDNLGIRNGGSFHYNQALASFEAVTSLINSRETDRRFMSVGDNQKGMKGKFGFAYGSDVVIFEKSAFCPSNRIYLLPMSSAGAKCIDLKLCDLVPQRVPGGEAGWMLKPNSSGGHDRDLISYLVGHISMASNRPSAIGVVHNFTI